MGSDTDDRIGLTLDATGVQAGAKDAAEAVDQVKDKMAGLAAVMEQIESQGETLEVETEDLAKSEREQAMEAQECARVAREIAAAHDDAAVKIDAATAKIYEQIRAMQILRGDLEETGPLIRDVAGSGDEEAGGGFKQMAGQALKAEKAVKALASGTGLGRLGGMLEGVLGPMGVPGLGLALGGLAFALEPLLPKIKEFVEAWETGIKPIDDATAAIERLDRAQTEARQKRALGKIESQITALEDKEDTQGWLDPGEQMRLRNLREASFNKRQEFDMEAQEAAQAKVVAKNLKDQEREDTRNAEARVKSDAAKAKKAAADAEKAHERKIRDTDEAVGGMEGFTESWKREQLADLKQQQGKAQQAQRQADADAKRQQADAAKYDREHTPLAVEAAAQKERQQQMEGIVAQNTYGFQPDQQKQIASAALHDVNLGFDLASAVRDAVYQTQQKIYRDYQATMQRQQVTSESYYSAEGF